jgi:hypothetical protein
MSESISRICASCIENAATWLGFSSFLDLFGLEDEASSELDLAGLTVGSYRGDVAEVAGGCARNVGRAKTG